MTSVRRVTFTLGISKVLSENDLHYAEVRNMRNNIPSNHVFQEKIKNKSTYYRSTTYITALTLFNTNNTRQLNA